MATSSGGVGRRTSRGRHSAPRAPRGSGATIPGTQRRPGQTDTRARGTIDHRPPTRHTPPATKNYQKAAQFSSFRVPRSGIRDRHRITRVRGDVATGWRGDPGGAGGRAEWVGSLRLHQRVGERGRDSLDGRRPVLAGDHRQRLQGDRRSRPAAGAVRVGKYRCIQRMSINLHADQGLGPGPRGGRAGGLLQVAAERTIRTSARATRTSVGRFDGRCWRRTFVQFNAPGVNEDEIQAASERLLNLAAP